MGRWEQRAAQAVGARGEAATQPLSSGGICVLRAVAREGKAGRPGEASAHVCSLSRWPGTLLRGSGACGHSCVPFLAAGSELAREDQSSRDSAPTLGASESLHQGMGSHGGNQSSAVSVWTTF